MTCPHVPRQTGHFHETVAAAPLRLLLNPHAFEGNGCVKRNGPVDKHAPDRKELIACPPEGAQAGSQRYVTREAPAARGICA